MYSISQLLQAAGHRRTARAVWRTERDSLNNVILAAHHAGASPADIVRAAARVHNFGRRDLAATSRQGVHQLIASDGHRAEAAWREVGEPDQNTALARALIQSTVVVAALDAYNGAMEALSWQMEKARREGHGPTEVAAASGLAAKSAYAHLAAPEAHGRIMTVLGDLVSDYDEALEGFPINASRYGLHTHVLVNAFLEPAEARRAGNRAVQLLTQAGYRLDRELDPVKYARVLAAASDDVAGQG